MKKIDIRIPVCGVIDLELSERLIERFSGINRLNRPLSVTLLISSSGGQNNPALFLYNFIRQLPYAVDMHAVGRIGSAANILFAAGRRRTCSPSAAFFFHAYGAGTLAKASVSTLRESLIQLDHDIHAAQEILRERSNLPAEIVASLDGGAPAITLPPSDALRYGLVDEVNEIDVAGSATFLLPVSGISKLIGTTEVLLSRSSDGTPNASFTKKRRSPGPGKL